MVFSMSRACRCESVPAACAAPTWANAGASSSPVARLRGATTAAAARARAFASTPSMARW